MFLHIAAATGGIAQHLLIHRLLCSSLLRVLLHQLGELSMDSLDRTNRCYRLSSNTQSPLYPAKQTIPLCRI